MATLSFVIKAVDEATKVVRDIEQELGGLDRATNALSTSMQRVGTVAMVGMAGGAAALAGGLTSALMASGQFEKQLNVVASVAGATGAELEGLKRTALDLGQSTAFSAGEVAQAMEVLAANGISTRDIIQGAAKAALDLAAAGSTSLVQAADTVSTAMAVWGLTTDDLTDTVNRLAGAANVSRFGVEDMSLAIAQGGGAAAAAGVEFADFAAAVAAIAPLFASGSDAGTSLKTFLQRLVPDTKSATEAFQALGLITADGTNVFFDANGQLKSMAEIAGELNDALNGLSEQDRTRLLANAFGADAMRAAIGLSRLTADELTALQTAMGEASAADIGAQRMQGLAGAIEQFKGALETARIEIGDRLNPIATRFFTWLGEQVPRVTSGVLDVFQRLESDVLPRVETALNTLRAAWDRVREPVMQFAASGEGARIALGVLAAVLLSVAVAAGSAALSLAAAAAPVLLLGLAIGGVLIVLDKLGVNWGAVWGTMQEIAEAVWSRVQPLIGDIVALFAALGERITAPIGAAVALVRQHWDTISDVMRGPLQIVQTVVQTVFEGIRIYIDTTLGVIRGIIQAVTGLISGDWDKFWQGIQAIVSSIWQGIQDLVDLGIRAVKGVFEGLVTFFSEVGPRLLSGAKAVWEELKTLLPRLAGEAVDGVKAGFEALPGLLLGLGEKFLDAGKGLMNALFDGITAVLSGAAGIAGNIADAIVGAIKDVINSQVIDRLNSLLEFTIPNPLGKDVHIDPPDIPHLASGGIIRRAGLAVVGEAGPELVMLPAQATVLPHAIARAVAGAIAERTTGPSVTVQIMGPVTIAGERDIEQTASSLGYSLAASLRARGVV